MLKAAYGLFLFSRTSEIGGHSPMLRAFVLALLLLTLSCGMASAHGGRVALVVGVSPYEHASSLPHTLDDAQDMSAGLKRLGCDVETMVDPSRSSREAAVRRYGDRSTGVEVSVLYFSGHALEVGGHNWLLPATTNLKSQRDLRCEAVDVQTILEQTAGTAQVAIVFLDAYRDNPFAGRISAHGRSLAYGLAQVGLTASGMLLVCATAPGQVALDGVSTTKNSLFTAALLVKKKVSDPNGTSLRHKNVYNL